MSATLTIRQKKEWAQMLYTKEHLTQVEISERTGVSKVTVCKWVKDGKWDELKTSITITREEQLKNLYRQLSELNKSIADRSEGNRYPSAAEADAITKMANAIKKLESDIGLSDIISVFGNLLGWLRTYDLNEAKRITPVLDAYVKSKLD